MPYINQARREALDYWSDLSADSPETPGELNYRLTRMCLDYAGLHPWGYDRLNDVIGVLECCKLEMYRRLVAPFEDHKKEENGDVY